MYVRAGEEIFFLLMLDNYFQKIFKALLTMEYLPFPVLNVFLQVERCGFGNAEILHGVGYLNSQVLSKVKEMIYRIPTGENNG
jgi:hypothetical protein